MTTKIGYGRDAVGPLLTLDAGAADALLDALAALSPRAAARSCKRPPAPPPLLPLQRLSCSEAGVA